MGAIRTFWRSNRLAVALFFALALSVKLLVPQGFMLGQAPGARFLTVQLCYDGITHRTTRIAIPGQQGPADGQTHPDHQCPYASLAMGATGAADVPAVAAPAALAPVRDVVPVAPVWRGRSFNLPPPSRGPPASA